MKKRPNFSQMKNMSEVQLHNVRSFGEYTQFIYDDRNYSNKEIANLTNSIAIYLRTNGVKRLSKVAICTKLCPEAFAVFPGAWFVGATICPINHKLSGAQIREILEMTESEVFFVSAEVWDRIKDDLQGLPKVKRVVTLQGARENCIDLTALKLPKAEVDWNSPSLPEDPALILFSSGSTGKPKGIVQTQKNLVCEIEKFHLMHEQYGDPDFLSPQTQAIRVLFNTPLGHTAGTVALTLNMANGSTFILQDVLELEDMLGLIQRHKIQAYFYGPPTVYAAMLEYPHLEKYDISSMKYWATGAAPISHERVLLLKDMLPGKFGIMYGLTETACVATAGLCDDTYAPNSVGRALPGVKIEIRDAAGKVLPKMEIGEVCIHGDNVSPGYLNLEDETKKSFQNGWLYSGDLGYMDENGNLFLSGRSKLMIIQGGVKIFPRTIETVLEAIPAIKECAVVGLADEILGERVVAYVSFKKDQSLTSSELKELCAKQLARYEVPRQFIFLDALPRTPTNKIDITLLRQGTGPAEDSASGASGTKKTRAQKREELQQKLIEIAHRLKVENLAPEAPLMQSGFDSLAAVEFAIAVQDLLGRKVPETLIFNFPTLNEVVDHLLADDPATEEALSTPPTIGASFGGDIAIIGTACRLPGEINSIQDLWSRVIEKVDCIGEVPSDRWNSDQYFDPRPFVEGKIGQAKGGFINGYRYHDPKFFDLSLNEAKAMDPQQRVIQQMAWEAIENAMLDPRELEKNSTGVMIGISSYDFCALAYQSGKYRPDYTVGYMPPFIAGRLAHWLNLSGPTFVLDTACSSSLVALHLACQSLRAGDSDVVIVGGLGMMLTPTNSQSLSMMGILAPDSTCKTFDASANGTVRSEGGAVVLVKRLEDAERDGNRILGVIKGSAVNHDAKSSNVGAPSGKAQVKVIKTALRSAGMSPDQVDYVEAHGTGTALGDAIELYSISEAYQADPKKRKEPLYIGSVKANIGHTEGGAGISGLMKILASFENSTIPPQIGFKKPNPKFAWSESVLSVPLVPTAWKKANPVAAVSSFGITGTNAHVIVQKYEAKSVDESSMAAQSVSERSHHILCLSAKSDTALRGLAQKYHRAVEKNLSLDLADLCHTANLYRTHFAYRQAIVFTDRADLLRQLESFSTGKVQISASGRPTKLAFCFTGQGGAGKGLAQTLLASNSVFRESVAKTDLLTKKLLNLSFQELVTEEESLLRVRHTQAAVSSLQIGLVEMLKRWGIVPTHVIGHSGGEFVAAATAGMLSPEDALNLAMKRALLIEKLTLDASMATSFTTAENLKKIIAENSLKVEIAATNAPQLVTIVGKHNDLSLAVERLNSLGIKTRILKGTSEGVGFHSAQVDPILGELDKIAEGIRYSSPSLQYFSSHLGRRLADQE
ncbi:MAG: beta-ketoacyl synthase N-terminal-like domain-containing protein, partial [Bdellovibrionales bacterium]|nr:beta-ketoacyl synthase N-terminal-like domain-containing protein [Bdellovibrionales bacterium]